LVNVRFAPTAAVPAKSRHSRVRVNATGRDGRWRHIWRVVGQYKNVSIFDVADHDTLDNILTGLPLYPFMEIEVVPLCRHPSSIRENDS
jgi:muconolactone D-isomerase